MPNDEWRKDSHNFQEPFLSRSWTLRNPAVNAGIVGIRSARQAQGIAGAADLDLSPSETAGIENQFAPA
jgi:aryl-alcohol dehydrogenase-like predicted oxidoreductase